MLKALLNSSGYCLRCFFLVLCVGAPQCYAQHVFDWAVLQGLYDDYAKVDAERLGGTTLLDYQSMRTDSRVPLLRKQLADYAPRGLSKSQQLAFYINAYNFFAIDTVLKHPDARSIRDIGRWYRPVWRLPAGIINDESVSLHTIEHEILRKMEEPRIHFAIVCASLSCPNLRTEVYSAGQLDAQLNAQALAFIYNQEKGVRVEGNTIYLSSIFDWFEGDFVRDLPHGSGDILHYIRIYRQIKGEPTIRWLPYDWSLNSSND